MGRGSAYRYEYFMLIDDEGWEEWQVEDFNQEIRDVFKLYDTSKRPDSRDSYYLGVDYDDTILVGVDYSGGLPCLFVEPYVSDYYDEEEDGELPDIKEKVEEGFNKLLSIYRNVFFYPTSAWTSEPYGDKY